MITHINLDSSCYFAEVIYSNATIGVEHTLEKKSVPVSAHSSDNSYDIV